MKNKLMLYQGGGYSGCHWEWNYCFWDDNGEWFSLYSSGKDGIESEKAALEYAESIDYPNVIVDLTSQDEIDKMYKGFNEDLILSILDNLNEQHDYELEVVCSGCNEYCTVEEEFIFYEGVCPDCYSSGTCEHCNEYAGPDDLEINTDTEDNEYWCSDCVNDERYEELKELFFKAKLTGEPDMFGDQFREFWDVNGQFNIIERPANAKRIGYS